MLTTFWSIDFPEINKTGLANYFLSISATLLYIESDFSAFLKSTVLHRVNGGFQTYREAH